VLVERTADSEPATAIISSPHITTEDPTRSFRSGDIPSGTIPAFPQPQARSRSKLYAAIAAAAVLILVAGIFGYRYYSSNGSGQIASIAVMPFTNESGNADVEYLSDGMTETLIGSLSQVPNLNVKGRSSVFRYKGKDVDTKTLGKELGVQAVLFGRVNQRGDQLTLSLELLDATTENVIWSGKYERKQADVVSLQSEVARDVSGKLKSKLSGVEAAKVQKSYTANPEAYELYLKGRFAWNKRTTVSLKQAAEFYKQAIEKDPSYALAHSALAETYSLFSSYSVALTKDSMPQARASAERAIELDPTLAAPHAALEMYYSYYEFDRVAAEREIRRAIELDPDYATAHQWLTSDILTPTKRFDEALVSVRRAGQIDPLSPIIGVNTADVFLYSRRYDEALVEYNRTLSLDPNFAVGYYGVSQAYWAKGMPAEAINAIRKYGELSGDATAKGQEGLYQAKMGRRDEALKILAWLKNESAKRYVPSISFALVYIGLGDKERTFEWLEREVADHGQASCFFAVTPELDELRSEPRFKAMLKQLNLPE
jgi:TolB-like protein/Tfp pilus assembly protein PilF